MLDSKIALVTGASRGIGRKIAETFVDNGCSVAFTYLKSKEKGEELEKILCAGGTKSKGYQSDASQFYEVEKLIDNVLQDFGRIDIVVNNAGVTQDNLLLRMSEKNWDDVMDNNLKSLFNITKLTSRLMMRNRYGVFINISSIVGLQGNAGQANYATSKAGIIGFSKSIAKELGSRNIRTNVIAPGFIKTEMTEKLDEKKVEQWTKEIPLKRLGETQDVANVALFLASDLSAYVNGQVIAVCGGMV